MRRRAGYSFSASFFAVAVLALSYKSTAFVFVISAKNCIPLTPLEMPLVEPSFNPSFIAQNGKCWGKRLKESEAVVPGAALLNFAHSVGNSCRIENRRVDPTV